MSCLSSHAQTAIGRVIATKTEVVGDIDSQSRRLATGQYIHENELITTNSTGLGQFEISDGTRIVVGPSSKLVLESILYNSAQGLDKFVLSAAAGAVRFISGSKNSSAYKINTPVGVLGLRGTAFDFHVQDDKAFVMLIEGQVEFCSQTGNCKRLSRRCDYLEADLSGNVSDPMRPATGTLSSRDRRKAFPFIASQARLRPQFRLRVQSCRGSASRGEHGGGGSGGGSSGGRPEWWCSRGAAAKAAVVTGGQGGGSPGGSKVARLDKHC